MEKRLNMCIPEAVGFGNAVKVAQKQKGHKKAILIGLKIQLFLFYFQIYKIEINFYL